MSLKGKRVVVIGGATGIGFAIAELAHKQGASVVLGSSNKEKVQAASARLPDAMGHAVDLRYESSVNGFFKQIGDFDHLAITAGDWGGPMFVSVHDLDLKQAQELLSVRFWGALAAVKHSCQTIARNGSITLTSGMIGHRPRKGAPVMAAVGGAIEHLAAGLAMDLNPVRVNAVNPGYVLTEQLKRLPEAVLQSAVAPLPIPRAATPLEAAQAYVYLMLNNYATGQTLSVDGGGLLV
jgi:NAD(P)-dependent dehydrogenase (short-subunit alcohol dehydrogenase family)